MNELSKHELEFIDVVKSYPSPAVKPQELFITDSSQISRDDEKELRRAKIKSFHTNKDATKELIHKLDLAMNNSSANIGGMADAIKQDKDAYANLVQLGYEWVKVWDKAEEWHTDPRNERSTELCKDIADALRNDRGYITNDQWYADLESAVFSMHRTLVQQATSLFERVLADADKTVEKTVTEKYGYKDISLPMI